MFFKVIKSKKIRLLCYLTCFAVSGLVYFLLQKGEFIILPENNVPTKFTAIPYDDREQNGKSVSEKFITKQGLQLRFKTESGFAYPYAGISFLSPNTYFPFENFNSINLRIEVNADSRFLILLTEHHKTDSGLISKQHLEYLLNCKKDIKDYRIALSSFHTPDWWIKAKGHTGLTRTDWNAINTLSVQNDPSLPDNSEQTVIIKSIRLDNINLTFLYILSAFVILIIVIEVWLFKRKKNIEISFVPLQPEDYTRSDPWETISYYLAVHYKEDISLETVFKDTGIGKHKISALIKERTTLNFRHYINLIRINEAEKLLRNTSLSITEVGYEVGYSSATQFNRVFRDIKGIAPSEFKRGSLI